MEASSEQLRAAEAWRAAGASLAAAAVAAQGTLPPWWETDAAFEGVGAHPLNVRYDIVDELDADLVLHAPLQARRIITRAEVRRLTAPTLPASYVKRFDWVDGSHWQPDAGPMDLGVLMDNSLGNALAWKATQSTSYVDPTLKFVRSEMLRLQVELQLFYHWLSSTTDPEKQAAHYIKTIGIMAPGQLPMGDFEEAGITVEWCLGFKRVVEKFYKRPLAKYSGLYVAGGTIWRDPRLRESPYGPVPMHLAAYVTLPSLLTHLTRTGTLDLPIHAWQHTSDGDFVPGVTGSTPGITGRADWSTFIDRSVYERAALIGSGAGVVVDVTPTPSPAPVDVPSEAETEDEVKLYTSADWWVDYDDNGKSYGPREVTWELAPDHEGDLRLRVIPSVIYVKVFGGPAKQELDNETIKAIGYWTPAPRAVEIQPTVNLPAPGAFEVAIPATILIARPKAS